MVNIQNRFVHANGIRFHLAEIGNPKHPLVLLLHGFPEFWYGWRHQMIALAEAGFYVVAPDQRGYNLTDKPLALESYTLDTLAHDATAVIEALGHTKAFLAGHDWGAVVAWWVAHKHPQVLHRMVAMNAPHPQVMEQALRHNFQQLRRSWYILAMQIPWLPEKILSGKDFEYFAVALGEGVKRNALLPSDLEKYKTAWRQPGSLTAMLNWYRAALRHKSAPPTTPQINIPVLVMWGLRDRYLGQELAAQSLALCSQGRLEMFEGAGHFVQHDTPEEVSEQLVHFFMAE